jgi:hypothetical protein
MLPNFWKHHIVTGALALVKKPCGKEPGRKMPVRVFALCAKIERRFCRRLLEAILSLAARQDCREGNNYLTRPKRKTISSLAISGALS